MLPVLMLFLIPVGGGIPAGVLLARSHHIAWPVTAGHGFITGWAIAIAGDMIHFGVIMAATLKVNSVLGDPNRTMIVILIAMFILPVIVRRLRSAYATRGAGA